jgi:hypothetical protein
MRSSSDNAIELLRGAVTRSKRREQVPFGSTFLRSNDDTRPPLARLIQGGRGGRTRLKLYLTITMMATRSPHDIQSLGSRPKISVIVSNPVAMRIWPFRGLP